MGELFSYLPKGLGQVLNLIYNTIAFHNYGLAIIIFTIIVRMLILPLTLKQYRSSMAMQALQPQLQEIQKRYKGDKQKLQMETMKFYQENKVNPAGGCLPLLIQFPILISLWQVIARPLTYMLNWNSAKISEHLSKLTQADMVRGYKELSIVIHEKVMDMHFLGLNLGMVPKLSTKYLFNNPNSAQYLALLLIPISATVTTFISSKMMMSPARMQQQSKAAPQMAGMQTTMMYIAPLMTLFFSFQFPAGLGLYWTTGYVIQIFQQIYINKTIYKKKEVVVK